MKLLVFLLVLANVLFYAFAHGYLGQGGNPDAGRVEQQLSPERLRIVSRGEAPLATKPKSDAPAEPAAPQPLPEPAKESPGDVSSTGDKPLEDKAEAGRVADDKAGADKAPAEPATCLVWRQLTPTDADRLSGMFSKRFAEYKLARKTLVAESNGWWVNIPALPNRADADKKATELRDLGVSDFLVIQDGPNRNAISLGVFSTEKGAQDRLAELKGKGVRSAVAGRRPGKEDSVTVQVRGPAAERAAVLKAAADTLTKSEPQACK